MSSQLWTLDSGRAAHLPDGVGGADELVVILVNQRLHVVVERPDVPHHLLLLVHQLGQGPLLEEKSKEALK